VPKVSFDVTLSDGQVRAIYYALHEAYERWPGAPQRPVEEQEHLVHLKAMFFAMQLESRLDWK
jgi:hypothetical protein